MPARSSTNQIAFRCRTVDGATGVRRETAEHLAENLGVDETQAIHRAPPQYVPDDGQLRAAQIRQIKKQVPQRARRSVRSSLFNTEPA